MKTGYSFIILTFLLYFRTFYPAMAAAIHFATETPTGIDLKLKTEMGEILMDQEESEENGTAPTVTNTTASAIDSDTPISSIYNKSHSTPRVSIVTDTFLLPPKEESLKKGEYEIEKKIKEVVQQEDTKSNVDLTPKSSNGKMIFKFGTRSTYKPQPIFSITFFIFTAFISPWSFLF